ncbi:Microtubule-binding calmodulin-regulated spectrin-associated [Carpediemonas membranifera]|uniref:Microtubule-binding calmodulin-regulated spectrin-associated n=1 Tax=Carpediemonas membranifera TaxID=201153 RepID=A0A8J6APF5_9EUKA|nr:Microtubule-binding calmodulin-regulated spectrin-associated [Carpediemonas membranifera]|eukprot:KAG9389851.1 Microtubule-binding calmodulin-regulated spectrin-associated [Carpediemonas membranifera]
MSPSRAYRAVDEYKRQGIVEKLMRERQLTSSLEDKARRKRIKELLAAGSPVAAKITPENTIDNTATTSSAQQPYSPFHPALNSEPNMAALNSRLAALEATNAWLAADLQHIQATIPGLGPTPHSGGPGRPASAGAPDDTRPTEALGPTGEYTPNGLGQGEVVDPSHAPAQAETAVSPLEFGDWTTEGTTEVLEGTAEANDCPEFMPQLPKISLCSEPVTSDCGPQWTDPQPEPHSPSPAHRPDHDGPVTSPGRQTDWGMVSYLNTELEARDLAIERLEARVAELSQELAEAKRIAAASGKNDKGWGAVTGQNSSVAADLPASMFDRPAVLAPHEIDKGAAESVKSDLSVFFSGQDDIQYCSTTSEHIDGNESSDTCVSVLEATPSPRELSGSSHMHTTPRPKSALASGSAVLARMDTMPDLAASQTQTEAVESVDESIEATLTPARSEVESESKSKSNSSYAYAKTLPSSDVPDVTVPTVNDEVEGSAARLTQYLESARSQRLPKSSTPRRTVRQTTMPQLPEPVEVNTRVSDARPRTATRKEGVRMNPKFTIVRRAIEQLVGGSSEGVRTGVLEAFDGRAYGGTAQFVLVLTSKTKWTYKSLYARSKGVWDIIDGNGPPELEVGAVAVYLKFNSATREFIRIQVNEITPTVVAVIMEGKKKSRGVR